MRGWRNTSVTNEGKTIMKREHLKELLEGGGQNPTPPCKRTASE